MTVTSAEYKSLLPLIRGSECLHLCPRGTGQETLSPEAFVDLVIASAPSLNMLSITNKSDSDGTMFRYFPNLAGDAHFARLQELHLCLIELSLDDFKHFLHTAAPTLNFLNLEYVTLNDNTQSDFTEEWKDETRQFWQSAWNFLRLRFLAMRGLAHRGIEVRVTDRLDRFSGRSTLDVLIKPSTVAYNAKRAQISFGKWIDGLEARPFSRIVPDRGEQISVLHLYTSFTY